MIWFRLICKKKKTKKKIGIESKINCFDANLWPNLIIFSVHFRKLTKFRREKKSIEPLSLSHNFGSLDGKKIYHLIRIWNESVYNDHRSHSLRRVNTENTSTTINEMKWKKKKKKRTWSTAINYSIFKCIKSRNTRALFSETKWKLVSGNLSVSVSFSFFFYLVCSM